VNTLPNNLTITLGALAAFCAARRVRAWLVGGAARDLALGRIPCDLDIAVDTDGIALARAFADHYGGAFVALDDERGTGRVVLDPAHPDRLVIDLVQLRAPTLEEDLRLRDFTVNALALPLNDRADSADSFIAQRGAFIDPCGGLRDIDARELRACSPSSLRDDPLRILRAVRLAADLAFQIAPELDALLRESAPLLGCVAAERVRGEFMKLLALPHSVVWIRYLDDIRVLTGIIPELEPARDCEQPNIHFLPVLAHMIEAVACAEWLLSILAVPDLPAAYPQHSALYLPIAIQAHPGLSRALPYFAQLQAHFTTTLSGGISRAALFKLAVLLHDNAKPQTKQRKPDGGVSFHGHQDLGADVAYQVARRLRLSRAAAEYIALIVREHMRPGQLRAAEHVTPRAIVRFFRDTGDAGPDVLIHDLADHLATRGPQTNPMGWRAHLAWIGTLLDAYWGVPPERVAPLLNGNDVMAALGIGPGKLVGIILQEVQEAQAVAEIQTRAEALELARQIAAQHHERTIEPNL
jgi:poly(A) polymerase/tRNA nucleotidyltransferase (CCA-adding enzyme)